VARSQIHKKLSKIIEIMEYRFVTLPMMKSEVEIRLSIKIIPYSAMKISANNPELNSVLNPETSSDSPSAKSKGVRFVSAMQEISHRNNKGDNMKLIVTEGNLQWHIF
jgi:hypothetical protein